MRVIRATSSGGGVLGGVLEEAPLSDTRHLNEFRVRVRIRPGLLRYHA